MQRNISQPQHAYSPFPIEQPIINKTLSMLYEEGRVFLDEEVEILGKSNPYLLTAIAGISNIFEDIPTEAACIEGALLTYHMVSVSAEEREGAVPYVSEDDLLVFARNLDAEITSLNRFIATEIAQQQLAGDSFLLKALGKASLLLQLPKRELVAFGIGMIMTYNVLKSAYN